jgi:hyperosmotically inducible protein
MKSNVPRLALAIGAALLAAACDRPLAQPAMAADTLPQPSTSGAPVAQSAGERRASTPASAAPADPLSDAAITARVATGIHNDPALAGTDVSINTSHGVVSLTGTVKSPEQIAEASARAQAPDGVVRIDTHLSVVPP